MNGTWGELFSTCRRLYKKKKSQPGFPNFGPFVDGILDGRDETWERWSDEDFLTQPKNYWTDSSNFEKVEFYSVPPNFGDSRLELGDDFRRRRQDDTSKTLDPSDPSLEHWEIPYFSQFLYEEIYPKYLEERKKKRMKGSKKYECPPEVLEHRQRLLELYREVELYMKEQEKESDPVDEEFPTPYHYFKTDKNSPTKRFPNPKLGQIERKGSDIKKEYETGTGYTVERRPFQSIPDRDSQ
jgi:hypothetical protein